MASRIYGAALLAIALSAQADEPVTMELVHAQSDIVGALLCRDSKLGKFDFMQRLSPDVVLCVRSDAGLKEVVRVQAVLERAL